MPVPKGVRTRATPDWFARYFSTGGASQTLTAGAHFLYTSLYNDSTTGLYLHVFSVFPIDDINVVAPVFMLRETIGAQVASGSRINPGLGAPPGQIFTLDNGAAAIVRPVFTVLAVAFAGAVVQSVPAFIVPPGYSLVVGGTKSSDEAGCSFWYIPMTDPQGTNAA
jgi:hypothetical protein